MKNKKLLLLILIIVVIGLYCYSKIDFFQKGGNDLSKSSITVSKLVSQIDIKKIESTTDLINNIGKQLVFEMTNKLGQSFSSNPTYLGFVLNNLKDESCTSKQQCGLYSTVLTKNKLPFTIGNFSLKNNEFKFNMECTIDDKQFFIIPRNTQNVCFSGYLSTEDFMTKDTVIYMSKIGIVYILYIKVNNKNYFFTECNNKCSTDTNIQRICLTDDISKSIYFNIYYTI